MQGVKLLVEKGAQALELVRVAQLLGVHGLIIGAGEHLVAEGLGVIEHRKIGAPWLRAARQLGSVGPVEEVGQAVIAVFQRLFA